MKSFLNNTYDDVMNKSKLNDKKVLVWFKKTKKYQNYSL